MLAGCGWDGWRGWMSIFSLWWLTRQHLHPPAPPLSSSGWGVVRRLQQQHFSFPLLSFLRPLHTLSLSSCYSEDPPPPQHPSSILLCTFVCSELQKSSLLNPSSLLLLLGEEGSQEADILEEGLSQPLPDSEDMTQRVPF